MLETGTAVSEDILEGVTLEDAPAQAPEPEPAAPPEPATADAPPSDAPPTASPDGADAIAGTPAPPIEPPDLTSYSPPEGGEPLLVRLSPDGTRVTPEGAKVYPTGVWFPKDSWEAFRGQWVGNRDGWRQREAQLEAALSSDRERIAHREEELTAGLAVLREAFSNPEAMAGLLEDWQRQGPILQARAEAKQYQARLARYEQQEQETRSQQEQAALAPRVVQAVGDVVGGWLTDAGIQWDGVPEAEKQWGGWLREIIEDHGIHALLKSDPVSGQKNLDLERIHRLFTRELNRSRSQGAQAKAVDKVVARNAAAVAPAKPSAPVPAKPVQKPGPPRDEAGKFKPAEPFDADEYLRKQRFIDD